MIINKFKIYYADKVIDFSPPKQIEISGYLKITIPLPN